MRSRRRPRSAQLAARNALPSSELISNLAAGGNDSIGTASINTAAANRPLREADRIKATRVRNLRTGLKFIPASASHLRLTGKAHTEYRMRDEMGSYGSTLARAACMQGAIAARAHTPNTAYCILDASVTCYLTAKPWRSPPTMPRRYALIRGPSAVGGEMLGSGLSASILTHTLSEHTEDLMIGYDPVLYDEPVAKDEAIHAGAFEQTRRSGTLSAPAYECRAGSVRILFYFQAQIGHQANKIEHPLQI